MIILNVPAEPQHTTDDTKNDITTTLNNGVAEGYILHDGDLNAAKPGEDIALVCKEDKKRYEGKIADFPKEVGKAGNGQKRYSIPLDDMKEVDFKDEKFPRHGVLLEA